MDILRLSGVTEGHIKEVDRALQKYKKYILFRIMTKIRTTITVDPKLLSPGKQVSLLKKSSDFTLYLKFEKKEKDED